MGNKNEETAVAECKRRLKERVSICNELYNTPGSVYYHNARWHQQRLAVALNKFDECLAHCRKKTSRKRK